VQCIRFEIEGALNGLRVLRERLAFPPPHDGERRVDVEGVKVLRLAGTPSPFTVSRGQQPHQLLNILYHKEKLPPEQHESGAASPGRVGFPAVSESSKCTSKLTTISWYAPQTESWSSLNQMVATAHSVPESTTAVTGRTPSPFNASCTIARSQVPFTMKVEARIAVHSRSVTMPLLSIVGVCILPRSQVTPADGASITGTPCDAKGVVMGLRD